MTTIALDIGCGDRPCNPYKCDELLMLEPSRQGDGIITCHLGIDPIPLETSSLDVITAFDVVEHIPRVIYKDNKICNPFIEAMNEIWRTLKPGGIFYAQTPAYPAPEAFQDPTHVNIITIETARYFVRNGYKATQYYGFVGCFKARRNEWANNKFHLIWELEALK